jgi:predicted aldo/keto reductase-like oxidoreductase
LEGKVTDQADRRNRRQFIVGGLSGLAAVGLAPGRLEAQEAEPGSFSEIVTRKLGATGLELPLVSMGVMNADNPNLVAAALDSGIKMLDTAHYYQRGRNEEMIGEVIHDRPRDGFVLATKARASTVDRSEIRDRNKATRESEESFIQKVELSLERLRTDYVDILYLHSCKSREDALDEMALSAMQKLKKQGKVRLIGVSTHSNQQEVIQAALESGVYEVVLTAYSFKSKSREELERAMSRAAAKGLGVVAMKTQAGVYWDKERTQPIPMKAALRWALRQDFVHTAIPGFTTFDQLEDDLQVMRDPTLAPAEAASLETRENIAGLYCQQCGTCLGQCPVDLDIPVLMRGYMYAHGYRNLLAAKDVVSGLVAGDVPCATCESCSVKCPQEIDVRERALDVARIGQIPDDFLV